MKQRYVTRLRSAGSGVLLGRWEEVSDDELRELGEAEKKHDKVLRRWPGPLYVRLSPTVTLLDAAVEFFVAVPVDTWHERHVELYETLNKLKTGEKVVVTYSPSQPGYRAGYRTVVLTTTSPPEPPNNEAQMLVEEMGDDEGGRFHVTFPDFGSGFYADAEAVVCEVDHMFSEALSRKRVFYLKRVRTLERSMDDLEAHS